MSTLTDGRKVKFIELLRGGETGNGAARALGLNVSVFRQYKRQDPKFAADWQEALTINVEARTALQRQRNFGSDYSKKMTPTTIPPGPSSVAGGKRETPVYREKFLAALAAGHSVTKSCEMAEVAYATINRWRKDDAEFSEQWSDAVQQGIDRLEDEAFRRGVTGVEETIFGKDGKPTGTLVRYSDTLLSLMLRAKIGHYRKTELPQAPGPTVNNFVGTINVLSVPSNHFMPPTDANQLLQEGTVIETIGGAAAVTPDSDPVEVLATPHRAQGEG